jgi:hypothetical protein
MSVAQVNLSPVEVVSEHTTILYVILRQLSWTRRLKQAKTILDGVEVSKKNVSANGAKLLHPEAQKKIGSIKGNLAGLMRGLVRFPIEGLRIMPNAIENQVAEKLTYLSREADEFRLWLVDNYDSVVVDYNRDLWGSEMFEHHIQPILPKPDSIRRSYRIEYVAVPIGNTNRNQQQVSAFIRQARENLNSCIQSAVANIVELPRAALTEAALKLNESLSKESRISRASFSRIEEACQMLKNFMTIPGMADDELLAKITNVDTQLGSLGRRYSEREAISVIERDALVKAVRRLSEECENATTINATLNRFGVSRRIESVEDELDD